MSPQVGVPHPNTGSKQKDRAAALEALLKPEPIQSDDNSSHAMSSHMGGEGQQMIVGMNLKAKP